MKATLNQGYNNILLLGACLVAAYQIAIHGTLLETDANGLHHLVAPSRQARAGQLVSLSSSKYGECKANQQEGRCCASWSQNMDEWWLHHPEFFVVFEDDDGFCFERTEDAYKAQFFRGVHDVQWYHNTTQTSCDQVISAFQSNAGYAASINQIVYGFWAAHQKGVPFQISKHRIQMTWMFAPKNETSWAYCPSKDMNCYFLPLSDCQVEPGTEPNYTPVKPKNPKDNRIFQWLRLYAVRPKQHVRKHVYDYLTKTQNIRPLPWTDTNCTAMHVRRGDSGFAKFPWRRYAAVQEYIDTAQIAKGGTIVLLTDDESTIQEVETYHATDYNWIYLDRQRQNGTAGGFNRHIPSGDEALDAISIMAELKLAAQCQRLVAGDSGFVAQITDARNAIGKTFQRFTVKTRISEQAAKKDRNILPQQRVEKMLKEIASKNAKE